MKLSPRITTAASSAVANLCLIPETGGEEEGAERRGVELKPLGNGEHMQLKATSVQRQKLETDSEQARWGRAYVNRADEWS